ncbi:androgen-dependent TFPI-regulating protein-like [Macrosteles quadrilineatus]|uniref:androgen-dependent TFPI-regulating protein-like n=1 Tax=Macrosteles quadrilineatus TaxID=74068 RepID=UPI0023E10360|nr:androgen-dependent TFPI-regulating protein-like [Macrosteles quadrilineatus]XP_054269414.1 androgen-dependent TFPI-regulating protein-like [Macrosteles quadrilineatus]XP_054269415.1 androgen-dependent TFPI-regulating protein-like [Macrosteles quadrilineatus]XP_054269813.1 androgen-dependent TFPI-regulating protein-like [Macrosteles quadrilineatus]XP_054269814.1 androgen-dependent TFPI-regulating protein-like [Macrosteles quadrilineatus]XP_054269815.1 androgen-dependent TFPI-regulating prote
MAVTSLLYHVTVVGYFMVVTHWMKENMLEFKPEEINDPVVRHVKRFSLRYLTNWTFTLQTIYFLVALVEDVLSVFKGQERLKDKVNKFKNYFFTVLVAPMALLVSIVFWGIWSVDRNLIFPTVLDKYLPPWINHSLHTTTSVVVLLEMYLCFHKYPSFKPALLGITLYLLCYSVCLMLTYYQSGAWLYPVFKTLNWTLRITFCLATYVLAIALYGAQYFLNKVFWDEKAATKKAPKKKHKKH